MARDRTFTSPAIAEEMQRAYGKSVKSVKIELKHEKEVADYVRKIEQAHRETAQSKLVFR